MLRIAHLVDDTTPGGVTRYLDFIRQNPAMAAEARHEVAVVSRANPARRAIDADIIVSHLAISWRGLPGLMACARATPGPRSSMSNTAIPRASSPPMSPRGAGSASCCAPPIPCSTR